jgi:dipeptidyl aminopeptidase/acylaminoacyl peptidase
MACLSPDGRSIVFASYNKFLTFHDLNTAKQIRKVENLGAIAYHLCYSPDGKSLAWGSYSDGDIHVIEAATGRERRKYAAPQGSIHLITFFPDGKRLVATADDTTAIVWDFAGALETRKKLAPADLDSHWSALAESDAVQAFRSIRSLAASSSESLPFLKAHLTPAAPPDEKRIARLVKDLDSNQFEVREAAATDLEKLGELAVPAIQKALADASSPEVRRRLEALVEKQEEGASNSAPERLRMLRAIEVLEWIGTPEAKEVLAALAKGASGSVLTRESHGAVTRLNQRAVRAP